MAHPAKVKVVAMGRRWGKSFMCTAYALSCADHGAQVAWIAPTYRNSRPLWRAAEKAIAPVAGLLQVRRSEREIVFPSGGSLYVYSADNPDSIRGMAFDLVIIDEASRVSEEAWTDAIQPTLADRGGRAVLISTPFGRNWFYREFQRGMAEGLMSNRIVSYTAPSSANPNPMIREAFERARETISDRTFRQEWMAEFVEDGAGVFQGVRAAATAHVQDRMMPGHTYVAGLDWALTTDYTVLTVMDATTKAVAYVDRFNGLTYEMQRSRIAATCARFGIQTLIAESNAMGKPNNDMLRTMSLPVRDFTTTSGSKAELIERLASAFDHRGVAITDDIVLITELEAYEAERMASGAVRYGAPSGMHDDCVMSLALAWYAIDADELGAPGWVRFAQAQLDKAAS